MCYSRATFFKISCNFSNWIIILAAVLVLFGTEMKDKNVYEILFQLNKIHCELKAFTVGRLKRGWPTLKKEAANSC